MLPPNPTVLRNFGCEVLLGVSNCNGKNTITILMCPPVNSHSLLLSDLAILVNRDLREIRNPKSLRKWRKRRPQKCLPVSELIKLLLKIPCTFKRWIWSVLLFNGKMQFPYVTYTQICNRSHACVTVTIALICFFEAASFNRFELKCTSPCHSLFISWSNHS